MKSLTLLMVLVLAACSTTANAPANPQDMGTFDPQLETMRLNRGK